MADFGKIIEAAGIVLDQLGQPLSSRADRFKHDLILEQIDPHTNEVLKGGMRFTFRGDDLPEGGVRLFDGSLKTVRKEYPNNTIPDTQVIRTEEKDIHMSGHFWCIDAAGVSPMDKVEFLHAMRLQGYPCKLSYMGDRIIRLGFITEFGAAMNDETDIEWEMVFSVFQLFDDKITSNTLPVLSSIEGRNQDILGRLSSGANALANVLALLGQPDMARTLRNDMAAIIDPTVSTINSMSQAAEVFQAAGSIPGMNTPQFKDFGNKLSSAVQTAQDALGIARSIPINPTGTAEKIGGLAGTLSRRQAVRATSITTGRVSSDLQLMQTDAAKLFAQDQQMHIVGQNDTLRSISQQYYGDSSRWQDIARTNSVMDPQQVVSGMRLVIPK